MPRSTPVAALTRAASFLSSLPVFLSDLPVLSRWIGRGMPALMAPPATHGSPELDSVRRTTCPRVAGRIIGSVLALVALAGSGTAQTRPLGHGDVLGWKSIQSASLSPDGVWVAYTLSPMEGDPTVVVREASEGGRTIELRGERPVFTSDSRFVVLSVPPFEAVVDSLKREGTRNADLPEDSVAVVELAQVGAFGGGAVRRLGAVESYSVADVGSWIAIRPVETDEEPAGGEAEPPTEGAGEEGAEGAEEGGDSDEEEETKEAGDPLVLLNLETGAENRLEQVAEYAFAGEAEAFAFATSSEDGSADGVFVVELARSAEPVSVFGGESHFSELVLSEDGTQLAFLADRDDFGAEMPEFALYHASGGGDQGWLQASEIARSGSGNIPEGWWVSEHGSVDFSEGGERIFFGTSPRPEAEPDDDTPDDERVRVDVWNWKDPYLQPMQLVRLESEQRRTYRAVYDIADDDVVQLGRLDLPEIITADDETAVWALGFTTLPYRQLVSWDGTYRDLYSVSLETGESRLIAQGVKGFGSISPSGRYAHWWDGTERDWKVAELAMGRVSSAGAGVRHPLWRELYDSPDLPPPYGSAGWTDGDESFIFYDRFDAWGYEPGQDRVRNLTDESGREAGVRFRLVRTDPSVDYIPRGDALWSAFNETTKDAGYFEGRSDRPDEPDELVMSGHSYGWRGRAEDVERWLFVRSTFREYPDLWVTDGSITDAVRLSDANPQQAEFSWGDAELVEWRSNDGAPLQGILFTPDGFDPSANYPMMVYFYERMSDGLHSYRNPTPGGSSISISFYVSRGYVVFVPDIPYEIGYPGESALDAVVPGVLALIARGFVDAERIGVQGHSWGGYQIAYMLTKTDLFAAAEAGAPVANMTSAYGGIRWQSGMSRMFQYERTQSRIGGTLWEETQTYLHNSPLFFADKIRTPLLMMHNDNDGAVPWYQGIEMFVALRRLAKPVWMLNYNNEGHGLSRPPNRKDWAVRMQQFFDHYLMGAPIPVWMDEGVPATLKGKTLGTGLVGGAR